MFNFNKSGKPKFCTALTWLTILSLLLSTRAALAGPLTPRLVADINPGAASSNPEQLTNVNGTLYFLATTLAYGKELWRSSGTVANTSLVRDIKAGPGDSDIEEMRVVSGTLFFNVLYKQSASLWKVTGSVGTADQLIKVPTDTLASLYDLTNVNNHLYFFYRHSAGIGTAYELWKSDGFKAHTRQILALPENQHANNLVNVNGIAYFSAGAASGNGTALWKSNGTPLGTMEVKPLSFGSATTDNAWPTVLNDKFYFVGSDGTDGYEVFQSDGTAINTKRLANINPNGGSNPSDLAVFIDKLYFSADDGVHGQELWISNGTEAGTVLVKDINPGQGGSQPHGFSMLNGVLYFVADDGTHGAELWRSDGSNAGTFLFKDVIPGAQGSSPTQLTVWNNRLYFFAGNSSGGTDLWQSDGTEAGTVSVMPITPAINAQTPFTPTLTAVGAQLFFPAQNQETGMELWSLGNCPAGCGAFLPMIHR